MPMRIRSCVIVRTVSSASAVSPAIRTRVSSPACLVSSGSRSRSCSTMSVAGALWLAVEHGQDPRGRRVADDDEAGDLAADGARRPDRRSDAERSSLR